MTRILADAITLFVRNEIREHRHGAMDLFLTGVDQMLWALFYEGGPLIDPNKRMLTRLNL